MFAFADFRAVVVGMGQRWNAARTRLLLGVWLAGIGLLISIILAALITVAILKAVESGGH